MEPIKNFRPSFVKRNDFRCKASFDEAYGDRVYGKAKAATKPAPKKSKPVAKATATRALKPLAAAKKAAAGVLE
jgi:hypothetical protein